MNLFEVFALIAESLLFTTTGMTMEVLGTLVGAAIQGQIVASAHTLKHCPTHNMSAGYLGNSSSGAEIVKSLVRSQDYLSHSVSVTATGQEPRCAQSLRITRAVVTA